MSFEFFFPLFRHPQYLLLSIGGIHVCVQAIVGPCFSDRCALFRFLLCRSQFLASVRRCSCASLEGDALAGSRSVSAIKQAEGGREGGREREGGRMDGCCFQLMPPR